LTLREGPDILGKRGGLNMDNSGGKKKVVAAVKSLVRIKGSIYLCIPKVIVRKCNLDAGHLATIIAGEKMLTIVFPEPGA
jgi:hypothetical protein